MRVRRRGEKGRARKGRIRKEQREGEQLGHQERDVDQMEE